MELKELCQAYRNGHRWYIFDGSQEVTDKTRAGVFAYLGIKPVDDVPNGNCWQLVREIAFRLTGSEPIDQRCSIEHLSELEDCTVGDLIVISHAIEIVNRYYS